MKPNTEPSESQADDVNPDTKPCDVRADESPSDHHPEPLRDDSLTKRLIHDPKSDLYSSYEIAIKQEIKNAARFKEKLDKLELNELKFKSLSEDDKRELISFLRQHLLETQTEEARQAKSFIHFLDQLLETVATKKMRQVKTSSPSLFGGDKTGTEAGAAPETEADSPPAPSPQS